MTEENVESRKEMAKNSTSPEELEKLGGDENEIVRRYVAGTETQTHPFLCWRSYWRTNPKKCVLI